MAQFISPKGEQRAQSATEIQLTLFVGLGFLLGPAAAWFYPRWALVPYALAPLLRQVLRRSLHEVEGQRA